VVPAARLVFADEVDNDNASSSSTTLPPSFTSFRSSPSYGITNCVRWPRGKPPQDMTIVKHRLRVVSLGSYAAIVAVALFGCVIACLLIYFNFKYAHRRIVQHSHPSCNNLMLIGIIISLLSLVPGGLDGQFVSPAVFPVACNLGAWLLTIGFSMSYGAMFSKIWRVHRITRMTKEDGKAVSVVAFTPYDGASSLISRPFSLSFVAFGEGALPLSDLPATDPSTGRPPREVGPPPRTLRLQLRREPLHF